MSMERSEIISALRKLDNDTNELKELSSLLAITESQYIESKLPSPRAMTIWNPTPPSKKAVRHTLFPLYIFVIIGLVLLTSTIFTYVLSSNYMSVREEPGDEYISYINAYASAQTIEELETNWSAVEDAWKARGVNVDWEFILELSENYYIDSGESFDSCVRSALREKWDKYNTIASYQVVGLIVLLIPIIFFIKKTSAASKEYRQEKESYKKQLAKDAECKKYNDFVLPGLIEERNQKLPALRQEYAEAKQAANDARKQLMESIAILGQLLPQHYHNDAAKIALIIERGRADSIKEAINLFEDDKRAEEFAAAERRRIEAEELRQERMENEARRAAYAAEKAAEESALAARKAAQQEERNLRQRQAAASARCACCVNRRTCGYTVQKSIKESGDVCPSYRPQT